MSGNAAPEKQGKRQIYAGFAAFVVTGAAFMALGAFCGPSGQEEGGPPVSETAEPQPDGALQVTLDARDPNRWVAFSLSAGRLTKPGEKADLLVRRYLMRAPGGAADLGEVPLLQASVTPATDWTADEKVGDHLRNPVLSEWYDYSNWSHRLDTKGHSYAVRLASPGGRIAYLQVSSYQCEQTGSGCLTLRYRLGPE